MSKFRAKARAIELLGKGQIADLPTAISELWKNGYDAYAKTLGCDLFMSGYRDITKPCFVLFDDGFGMDDIDISDKWLILGTDSKARGVSYLSDDERFGISTRVPMGEKGIGRLSVSYLGSPMIMLTKKTNAPAQMLFMDWRILENYNLYVDDITIPVYSFVSKDDVLLNLMIAKEELEKNLSNDEAWKEQEHTRSIIKDSIYNVEFADTLFEKHISCFFDDSYHGTTFLIFEPNDQLLDLNIIDNGNPTDSALEMRRSLSGIYNLFVGEPDFKVSFNIYTDAGYYNIINDFFNKADFSRADHYIKGHFDNNGFFEGIVRVYDQNFEYKFHPIRIPGSTPYGSFDIELGVQERKAKTSLLNMDEYSVMKEKVEKFGGLYIYRDNFRVLPYGRRDCDFLQFESRRSQKMGVYYFGYTNMFGYIAITRKDNGNLVEKAGREGFVENRAYKEFKRDLIAFFIDIAKNYFASGDDESLTARSNLAKKIEAQNDKILAAEKKKGQQTKARFTQELKDFSIQIETLQGEIEMLEEELDKKARAIEINYAEYRSLADQLETAKRKLKSLKLERPRRATISPRQEEKLELYQVSYDYVNNIVSRCDYNVETLRSRFDVENLQQDYKKVYEMTLSEMSSQYTSYRNRFLKAVDRILSQLKEEQADNLNAFRELASKGQLVSKEDYQQAIKNLQELSFEMIEKIKDRYNSFVEHVEGLNFDIDDDKLVDWYQQQNKKLEDRMEMTNDLTQLGVSAEIIDHELNNYYSRMRTSMETLADMAKGNTDLSYIYNQLNISFQHIESNYKMLQPLYHTRKKFATEFTGQSVFDNMRLFFASRLEDVDFTCNDAFLHYKFDTYESVIVSVFINVLNNALYWLIPVTNKQIRIEYKQDSDEILIINNGELIEERIIKDIFMLFFTRRSGGRGIGLYLAKRSLNGIGLDIYATNDKHYNKLGGACFVICKYQKNQNEH